MPITAGEASSFFDMACPLSSVSSVPSQHLGARPEQSLADLPDFEAPGWTKKKLSWTSLIRGSD
jgi:hypothetical protein